MKMSKFLNFCVLTVVMSFVFTACSEDETLIVAPTNGQQETFFSVANDDDDLGLDEICFEFIYPINLVYPDGSTTVLSSDADLEAAVQTSIASGAEPTFSYPIQVEMEDGTIVNVADDETLCNIVFDCFDEYDEECFEFNFPVTLVLPDGTNATANDWNELETILDNYYDNPQNIDGEPSFVYPISVTMSADGTVQTINSDAEGEALFEQCYGDFDLDCFEFVFPLSFTMSDGSTISGNDEAELVAAFDAYIAANPNDTTAPVFNYPVDVILADGTTQTINNDVELETLLMDCFGDDWDGFGKVAAGDVVLSSRATVKINSITKEIYDRKNKKIKSNRKIQVD